MIYITYYNITYTKDKFVVDKYHGPYMKTFNTQEEAMEWVRSNNIDIVNIDRM